MPRQAGSSSSVEPPATEDHSVGGAGTPAQGRELRARGRRTLRKLLDAGIEVFATKGYHAARVDDVVKVAKTSHGTFYLYFANKEDLFAALVRDVAERLAEVTGALTSITGDEEGLATLRAWISEFVDLYATYGSVIRTWTEAEADDTEVGQIATDVLGSIGASVAAHLEGAADDIDRDIAAMAFVAMTERFNYFIATGQIDADRDAIVDTLAAVTHAGLFGTRS